MTALGPWHHKLKAAKLQGPQRWEASTLTTVPSLYPQTKACKHWQTQPAGIFTRRNIVQIALPLPSTGLGLTGSSEPTTSKANVGILICEDSRVVHLELLNSLTTEYFLQAFGRMAN